MTTTIEPPVTVGRRFSGYLHSRPTIRLVALLSLPLFWLVVAYLGSLAVLFASAFWSVDSFTGNVNRTFTTDNIVYVLKTSVFRAVTLRTIGVAAAVTVICAVLAIPMAFFMAKVASRRAQRWLVIAVLTPLWASYLVKAYAWRTMLQNDGVLEWMGLPSPGFGLPATIITLSYLWLPFMILPIYAGLERLPDSLLDASGDLGARSFRTFRSVAFPLMLPAIAAGSIFTFSLSLGDYIAVKIVGAKTQMLGNVVYDQLLTANNLPLAAAVALIPVLVMVIYLMLMRRAGALSEL